MASKTIFLILSLMLFIGIAYFTAKIFTTTLGLSNTASRAGIIGTMLVPLFFAASLITTRMLALGVGPKLYTLVNIITGLFFYLFIGALGLGVVAFVFAIQNIILPTAIPMAFFLTSLAMGIIGLIQAKFIVIKKYNVILDGAPDSWHDRRAVLVTDTHFGLINHVAFADKVVKKIKEIKPHFVLHAGDFYDGPKNDTSIISEAWNKLKIPLFYTPGNHELYGNYVDFLESIRATGANVLDNKKMIFDGVQIAGITFSEGKNPIDATRAIENLELDIDMPSILINHPPTSLISAHSQGVNLMVSGHTHNGQFWPNTYLVIRVYGKYYYGHKKYKSMNVITSKGVGTAGPPMRLFNSPELVVITFKNKA